MKKIIIYISIAIIMLVVVFLGIYLTTRSKEEQKKEIMSSFNINFSIQDIKLLEIAILTEGRKRKIYTYR